MKEKLDALLKLQRVDLRIIELERDLARIPASRLAVEQKREEAQARVDRTHDGVADADRERRQLDRQIQALESDREKFLVQQAMVKTNKEYMALTAEIKRCATQVADAEDRLLGLLEAEEGERALVAQAESEFGEASAFIEAELSRMDGRKNDIEEQLGSSREERVRAAESADASLHQLYEQIRVSKGGLAVAEIHNGACGGCFQAVPPQKLADVRRQARVVHCEYCGRIVMGTN